MTMISSRKINFFGKLLNFLSSVYSKIAGMSDIPENPIRTICGC